jgi:hypothetical protein
MADGLDHPLNLMFSTLMDSDFEPGIALRLADLHHFRRCRKSILEFDAPLKGLDLSIVEYALDLDQVGFRDMVTRMKQGLCKIPVVGQQHEPFTVKIQPPDRKHPHRDPMQEILHSWTAFGVVESGHDVLRLVEDEIDIGLSSPQVLAVDLDVITIGIHLGAEFLHHMAIDRHTTGGNQLLGLTPGSKPGTGDEFL